MSKESILKKEQEALAEIDEILAQRNLTYPFLYEHLKNFVKKKFALEEADFRESTNLTELAAISLSRAMRISKDLVADYEAGENCEGATSTDVKRTLLLVKLQKVLSVKFSLAELMAIETLEDVTQILYDHLKPCNSDNLEPAKDSVDAIQNRIIEEFLDFDDPLSQYEYLIEYSAKLAPLPNDLKTDDNLVKGCQSKAWLVMESAQNTLTLRADSDTLIVRGVLQLLIEVLDGQPLSDVASADIYFPERAQIMATFSASRRQGVASIVAAIRSFATEHAREA